MRTMLKRLALLLSLALPAGAALAQTSSGETRHWARYAAGTQPIRLHHASHIRPDCEPMGEIRMAVPIPPKNGTLKAVPESAFTDFGNEEGYKDCSSRKTQGVTVYYQANEGFKGKEKFSFLIIFSDGGSRLYQIDMTVY